MRFRVWISLLLVSLAAFEPPFVSAQSVGVCSIVKDSRLTADWNPRSLAVEYRVRWISDTLTPRRVERLRLFLWPTSMSDSGLIEPLDFLAYATSDLLH